MIQNVPSNVTFIMYLICKYKKKIHQIMCFISSFHVFDLEIYPIRDFVFIIIIVFSSCCLIDTVVDSYFIIVA